MKLIQWCIVGSLTAGLFALPAFAEDHEERKSDQALQGKVEATEIGLSQTPSAVRSAIEQWAQGSTVKSVKEIRQGNVIQYKAEIERGGQDLEVLVNDQGQVLRAGEDVGVDEGIF